MAEYLEDDSEYGLPIKLLNYVERPIVSNVLRQRLPNIKGMVPIQEILKQTVEYVDKATAPGGAILGFPVGFSDIDHVTKGLINGNLIIVAGQPSMFISELVTNIINHVSVEDRKSVAIFSIGISSLQFVINMLASRGNIACENILNGQLTEEEWPCFTSAVAIIAQSKLFIDDTRELSLVDLCDRARQLKQYEGLDLIVVDYLQLIQMLGVDESREGNIDEVLCTLKLFAVEIDAHIIVSSILTRS